MSLNDVARVVGSLHVGSPPTGTVTFLFTDVQGSARLWEQAPEAMRQAAVRHDAVVEACVTGHGAMIVRPRGEGDSRFAVFEKATDAVAGAAALQRALYAEAWPTPEPLRVRMALHTGEGEWRAGDYYGTAVNRCARLRSLAAGGQTLVSLVTAELVRDALPEGVTLRSLGRHRLKDLERPEEVFQIECAGVPSDFPPLRSLDVIPTNLPIQLTSFIGREREISEIEKQLGAARVVTLTGVGGVGKTRLALQVAAEVFDTYSDGAWLVELAALPDPGLLPQTVAAALGLREEPGRPILKTLVGALQPKQLLLVLDNCEHMVEPCARLAVTILQACPSVRILATSREVLNAPGEVVWQVAPLSLPDDRADGRPADFLESEAVRLFVERAKQGRPGFEVSDRTAPTIVAVCRRLDGIPLAIELAAARLQAFAVEDIAARLDDRFRLLTGGSAAVMPRQQTLRAALDWSHDLLTAPEQTLFRRLSVFVGGWTPEAAGSVCEGNGMDAAAVPDLLDRLVRKSLVVADEHENSMRYRSLETVRQYALERLEQWGEMDERRRRHRVYFLKVAEQAEPALLGEDQKAWLDRLDAEHDNIRAALASSLDPAGSTEDGLRLAGAMWWFWKVRGPVREGLQWLERLLRAASATVPGAVRAKALNGAGVLAYMLGKVGQAKTFYEESLALRREAGDSRGIAALLNNLALVLRDVGDYAAARRRFEESLGLFRGLKDTRGISLALHNLGVLSTLQGDYVSARSLIEESLALRRELRDRAAVGATLTSLAEVSICLGDLAAARSRLTESLGICREMGDERGVGHVLHDLGLVHMYEGDYQTAHDLFEQGLEQCKRSNFDLGIPSALIMLGAICEREGDFRAAHSYLHRSLAGFQALGDRNEIASALGYLAQLAASEGHFARAARLFGAEEALREAVGAPVAPVASAAHDRRVAVVRSQIGDEAFRTAWAEGRAMPLEQAIAYADAPDEP